MKRMMSESEQIASLMSLDIPGAVVINTPGDVVALHVASNLEVVAPVEESEHKDRIYDIWKNKRPIKFDLTKQEVIDYLNGTGN